jgi:carbonic anhydrase/acetyltransferase-like protein (isoleucine patch superfamily)
MHVPAGTLVAGVPARVRKQLDGAAARWVRDSPRHYVDLGRAYRSEGIGNEDPGAG